jgi:type II secretory pathway pseudopilin PulG
MRSEAGFTTLEVLVALCIIALASGAVLSGFRDHRLRAVQEARSLRKVNLAQSLLARVGGEWTARPGRFEGQESDRLSWRLDIAPWAEPGGSVIPRLLSIELTVTDIDLGSTTSVRALRLSGRSP